MNSFIQSCLDDKRAVILICVARDERAKLHVTVSRNGYSRSVWDIRFTKRLLLFKEVLIRFLDYFLWHRKKKLMRS